MALKQATKDKLKAYGLDVEKLVTAIKEENEVDYDVPERVVMTPDDLEARDNNKIAEGKRDGEKTGETKGKDITIKAIKKKLGIESETKDPEKLAEEALSKLATGDAGLREQISLLQKDKEVLQTQVQQEQKKAKEAAFDASLIAMFPGNRSSDLSDQERLALVKMNYSFEEQDGKTVVKRNGTILRDNNSQNAVEVSKAITDLFTEKKWITAQQKPGGRGGNDDPQPGPGGAGITKMSDAQAQWIKDNPGKNVVSDDFTNYVNGIAKDNPNFDMYN